LAWNDDLEGAALRIASCDESPLRVMAGPGTGKSFSMKKKVHKLLEEDKVEPRKILAITFTRTAAADIIKELGSLGVEGCEDVYAGTLHSYCYRVLMRDEILRSLNRYPRSLVSFPKSGILQFEIAPLLEDLKLYGNFGNKRDMTRRINAFESAWARLQSDNPGWPTDATDKQFHTHLISWLKFHKAMIIGEIIPETLRYLKNNPTCDALSAYEHIIVDEFQDLNKAEQVLIDILSSNAKTFIIGDEDQSIYSFRYAHPEGIREYHTAHPNTHDEPLQECRRCSKSIVRIANALIANNHPGSSDSRLAEFQSNPEGEIHIVQWKNLDEEVENISNYVKYLLVERNYKTEDILILTSRRLIGYRILSKLLSLDIPTHSFYYDELLESEEGQIAFTLLSLLANSEDRVSLRYWLGYGSNTWLANQYKKIRDYAEANNLSAKDVLEKLINGEISIDLVSRMKKKYESLLQNLEKLNSLNIYEIFDLLFPEDKEWSKPIRKSILPTILAETSVQDLQTSIRNLITQPELPEKGEYVRIMSLHKSKGLTSKVVIMPTVVQGLIPTLNGNLEVPEQERLLKEHRRLFYVGITRAKEILILSSIKEMETSLAYRIGAVGSRRSGANILNIASEFISELGPTAPATKLGLDWVSNNYQ